MNPLQDKWQRIFFKQADSQGVVTLGREQCNELFADMANLTKPSVRLPDEDEIVAMFPMNPDIDENVFIAKERRNAAAHIVNIIKKNNGL